MTSTPFEAHERINQATALLEKLVEAANIAREAGFNGVAWRIGTLAEEVTLLRNQTNPMRKHGRT